MTLNRNDKARDDLLWLIMVAGLVIGGLLTVFGILSESMLMAVIGIIFVAFGGTALFVRLGRR